MKPQELRVGNWIYPTKNSIPMCVVNVGTDYVYLDFEDNQGDVWEPDIKDMCGIPFTEELLLKLRFATKNSEYPTDHEDYHEWFERCFPVIGNMYQNDTKEYLIVELNGVELQIHYLHQFQNLLFALTGEELEVKL